MNAMNDLLEQREGEVRQIKAVLAEALEPFKTHTDDATNPAWVAKARALLAGGSQSKPRVLITVNGGVAEFEADEGVEVAIYDFDLGGECAPVPANFKDLAEASDVPFDGGGQ